VTYLANFFERLGLFMGGWPLATPVAWDSIYVFIIDRLGHSLRYADNIPSRLTDTVEVDGMMPRPTPFISGKMTGKPPLRWPWEICDLA
jgi:hypothetical protein